MKKLFYIANIRMPTERAHGIQVMEMCKAFVQNGFDVELIVPRRKTDIKDDPFVYYDIESKFEITKLWCLDWVRFGKIGFWVEALTFATSTLLYCFKKNGVFYTREELVAVLFAAFSKKPVWEGHRGQTNLFIKILIKLKEKIVVISEGLKNLYVRLGASQELVLVAPDGADIDRFDIALTQSEARRTLGLPADKKIILYKGSLEAWKGAGTLAESAKHAKTSSLQFVFIGGKPDEVEIFKSQFGNTENISILGNKPRKETPIYQKAADLLVIPNSAKEDISKLYTSPMKLFGYMAGGVPIVASDLPSLREILGDSDAYFFVPDDSTSLAQTIDKVFTNYNQAEAKAKLCLNKVRKYSWKSRAESILNFIQ